MFAKQDNAVKSMNEREIGNKVALTVLIPKNLKLALEGLALSANQDISELVKVILLDNRKVRNYYEAVVGEPNDNPLAVPSESNRKAIATTR